MNAPVAMPAMRELRTQGFLSIEMPEDLKESSPSDQSFLPGDAMIMLLSEMKFYPGALDNMQVPQ